MFAFGFASRCPAQQGQALLWQGWLEKHPDTVSPPWDDGDTRAAWDQHAAEAYYGYWDQYTYWAAQGWTAGGGGEGGRDEGTTGEPDAGATDPEDDGRAVGAEEVHHGTRGDIAQPGAAGGEADCEGRGEGERGGGLVELMVGMSVHTAAGGPGPPGEQRGGGGGGHGEPVDGGNDRKRAGSSSTDAENRGEERDREREDCYGLTDHSSRCEWGSPCKPFCKSASSDITRGCVHLDVCWVDRSTSGL